MHHACENFDGMPREHRYQCDNSETTRGRRGNWMAGSNAYPRSLACWLWRELSYPGKSSNLYNISEE